jgi:hypothetical protein
MMGCRTEIEPGDFFMQKRRKICEFKSKNFYIREKVRSNESELKEKIEMLKEVFPLDIVEKIVDEHVFPEILNNIKADIDKVCKMIKCYHHKPKHDFWYDDCTQISLYFEHVRAVYEEEKKNLKTNYEIAQTIYEVLGKHFDEFNVHITRNWNAMTEKKTKKNAIVNRWEYLGINIYGARPTSFQFFEKYFERD